MLGCIGCHWPSCSASCLCGQCGIGYCCFEFDTFALGRPLSCVLVLFSLSGDIIIDLHVAGNVDHICYSFGRWNQVLDCALMHQVGHYYILVACIANCGTVFHQAVLHGARNSLFYFFP